MTETIIWDFLYKRLGNPYGVAGLMGNLYVESRLEPVFLEGSYSRKLGMSSKEYTNAVDSQTYGSFESDSAGYGLVQWTYSSRKKGLLEFAKSHRQSVGDLNTQLEYLWKELQTYKTCLNTLKSAVSVKQASDIVCERYEKPADQSEKGKQNRAKYGQVYYDKYAGTKSEKRVVVTTDRVNVRCGNDKKFARICIANAGDSYELVATAKNGWFAVLLPKQVGWISGEFSKIE